MDDLQKKMIANDNSNNETLQSLTEQMNAIQTSLAVLEKEETDLQNSLVLIQHSVNIILLLSFHRRRNQRVFIPRAFKHELN